MTDEVIIQEEAQTEAAVKTEKQESTQFTQEQLERVVEERLARQRRTILKKYEGIDVEKYNTLVDDQETREKEAALKRQEFDTVLKQAVDKKETTIHKLQTELHGIKVEGALLNAASNKRAIKPQQVVNLLKNNIRLAEDGQVEVTDSKGIVRYTDEGSLMTADDLVEEFLQVNSHFITGNSAGSGSQSRANANQFAGELSIENLENLDMNNPEHRKVYGKAKQLGKM
tara:strand:+ start:6239 stop:6922 length:684 start_codon:yes stop_codon:yes gene_type:complete